MEQRTPQPVINKLFAARGELDVIFDLIAAVEQQQFVSLSHVPTAKDPAAVAQQAALRLARRREQLRSTADRIRAGTAAIREQAAIADRFLQDLKEIRKKGWRVCRRTSAAAQSGNATGSFYVDLSLPIEKTHQILLENRTNGLSAASTQVNIVPTAEGVACIVIVAAGAANGDEGDVSTPAPAAAAAHPSPVKVIKGPQSISEELQRRHAYHSWQVIETLLSQEAKKSSGVRDSNTAAAGAAAAIDAILRMASIAAAKRKQHLITNNKGAGVDGEDITMVDVEETEVLEVDNNNDVSSSAQRFAEKGFAAKDIESYCSTPRSQLEFESRALRCLAALCKEAQTPAIIKQTRGGDVVASMVEQMTGWLTHAALCYAVQCSLTRQTSDFPTVAVTSTTSATTTVCGGAEEKWLVSKNSISVGNLAVKSGRLRWYGPALLGITGQGKELGRAQLETFIEKVDLYCIDR